MDIVTRFVEPIAVEAWDAWFRWRDRGELLDLTIDATWKRVADAVAVAEGGAAALWSSRFVEAFASWKLLPDQRLLRDAGTGPPLAFDDTPVAVLNAAAFVRTAVGGAPRLDRDGLLASGALAVRLLDDALLTAGSGVPGLCIGLVGVADALSRLGLRYDSEAARKQASEIAAALADGCLQGTVALAAERGPGTEKSSGPLTRHWRARGTEPGLIADALRWGLRHVRLTAITPQPRLALFANHVADALDPAIGLDLLDRDPALAGLAAWPGASLPKLHGPSAVDALADVPALARIRMRAAVQPWVDAPIDYPLTVLAAPDADVDAQCAALARQHGMPPPCWRWIDGTAVSAPAPADSAVTLSAS